MQDILQWSKEQFGEIVDGAPVEKYESEDIKGFVAALSNPTDEIFDLCRAFVQKATVALNRFR